MKREYNEPKLTITMFCTECIATNTSMLIPQNSNQSDARNWVESKFSDENKEQLVPIIYF